MLKLSPREAATLARTPATVARFRPHRQLVLTHRKRPRSRRPGPSADAIGVPPTALALIAHSSTPQPQLPQPVTGAKTARTRLLPSLPKRLPKARPTRTRQRSHARAMATSLTATSRPSLTTTMATPAATRSRQSTKNRMMHKISFRPVRPLFSTSRQSTTRKL